MTPSLDPNNAAQIRDYILKRLAKLALEGDVRCAQLWLQHSQQQPDWYEHLSDEELIAEAKAGVAFLDDYETERRLCESPDFSI